MHVILLLFFLLLMFAWSKKLDFIGIEIEGVSKLITAVTYILVWAIVIEDMFLLFLCLVILMIQ